MKAKPVRPALLAVFVLGAWGVPSAAQSAAPPAHAGDQVEQAITLVHQADDLFSRRQYRTSLETYRKARSLFEAAGSKGGRAVAWKGEADALKLLQQSDEALAAYRQVLALLEEKPNPGLQGDALNGEADVLWFLGRNEQALAAYRQASSLFTAAGSPRGQAISASGEASALLRLGRLEEALVAHARARGLFAAAGDQRGQAQNWDDEGDLLLQLGRVDEALQAHRQARALYAAAGDRAGEANAWNGEAAVLFRQGDRQQALDAYRQARPLLEAAGDRIGQANGWNGEAVVLAFLNEREQALAAYARARFLAAAAGDRIGEATSWNGEGSVRFELGEYDQALDAYTRARSLYEAAGDLAGQTNTANLEAQVLTLLGERDRALDAYRAARRLSAASGSRLGQANALSGEAWVLFQRGGGDAAQQEALDGFRQARALYEAIGDRLGQANTLDAEASVRFWQGKTDQALVGYRQARTLYQAVGAQLGQAEASLGIARVLVARHDWQGAIAAATEAHERFQRAESVGGQMGAMIALARAQHGAGADAAAERSAAAAIRLHGQWRGMRIADAHRTESDQSVIRAYELLVPMLARQPGRAADALTRAEEARSRVLLDLLSSGPPRAAGASAVDLVAEHRRLVAENAAAEEQLAGATDPRQREELRNRRARLDQELEWNDYERAARDSPLTTGKPLDATAIQALARETGPILVYYVADEVVGFLVLPQEGAVRVERIALARWELEQKIAAFALELANPLKEDAAQPQARELWDRLLEPFAGRLPAGGSLVLIPHGPLHELPFEALRDPAGKLASERWRISVAPSASALAMARQRHRESQPGDSILALAGGRGLRLPESEVAEVAGFFPGSPPSLGSAAPGVETYRRVMSARQVFIATVGVHASDSRSGTYLEIQPTKGAHDSRLSAAEIATIPVEAELVTLAACDTAAGEAMLSDERLDLTRAFLIAGAAAVLATRWKVPEDSATSHFVADFYRAYRRGGPDGKGLRKDEALADARRRSRERGDPAQLWAAWVMVGDPR
ncbi:MAG TPA: CHAT domain-containing tetratricopeptide repeat protein [Thermoanaerobaculia bacterium]